MLARQIGAVTEGERLMNALGTSNNPANLNTAPPVDQNGVPLSDNATPAALPPPAPPTMTAVLSSPLLWAGVGLGTALLLTSTSDGHTMAGTKKKDMLIPLLIVGGAAAAWWYFSKPAAATAPAGASSPVDSAASAQRDYVMSWAATDATGGATRQAAIAKMPDNDVLQLYTIVHDYFATGTPLPAAVQGTFNRLVTTYPGVGG